MDKTKSHIGNDAIKLTASKIITMLIGLISSMLLSRFRTLEEYGTYSQLLMAINLACSIFMLGLPNCINYFLAKAKDEKSRSEFLSVYYTLSSVLSFIVGLVLLLSTPIIEQIFKNPLIHCFWYFLAFYPWTRVIMASVENLLIVYQKTTVLILYRVLNSIALLGIILVVQLLKGTFMQYMIAFLFVESIFTVWTYILVKQNSKDFKLSLNKELIKTIFTFSVPIGLASMIGTINIELDKLVITSFLSTEELAVYTNASKELPVTIIASSLTAVLMPQLVRLLTDQKNEEAVKLWNSATSISFAIISLISIGCFVFAPEVITILYSEKYLAGVGVFRVYCLTLLLRCTYWGMLLNATGNTKVVLYSSIGSLVLNVLLNYLCFYVFGFVGPAIATLLATTIMALFQIIYSSKIVNVKMSTIFPWKNCSIYMLINIGLGIISYFAKIVVSSKLQMNSVVLAILIGALWATLYLILLFKPLLKQWKILNKER